MATTAVRRKRRKRCPLCNELKANVGAHIWHAHGPRALKRYHKPRTQQQRTTSFCPPRVDDPLGRGMCSAAGHCSLLVCQRISWVRTHRWCRAAHEGTRRASRAQLVDYLVVPRRASARSRTGMATSSAFRDWLSLRDVITRRATKVEQARV
jgi:hypothetical protein